MKIWRFLSGYLELYSSRMRRAAIVLFTSQPISDTQEGVIPWGSSQWHSQEGLNNVDWGMSAADSHQL